MPLYTIGYSNHPIDRFLGLLLDHGIRLLVDVRSTPYSRFNPQFNQKALEQALHTRGIVYYYLGDVLGGRPKDPACYIHNTVPTKADDFMHEIDYPAVMRQPWFTQGIDSLLELAGRQLTCILCSEKDPAHCHRHHLIARYLLAEHPKMTIWHILPDSSLINAGFLLGPASHTDLEQLSFKV
ncbi:MAG: hypothetical protein C3F13_14720 [Anaerolineales bacterium]|nr:DUF488 domain-containing protein [Anaerolineae bacterium]PWB51111.1 MAG: hypothetical protein C3F13_14720 [Anaerolineales bacterium]